MSLMQSGWSRGPQILGPPVGCSRETALGAHYVPRPGAPGKAVLTSSAVTLSRCELRRVQLERCSLDARYLLRAAGGSTTDESQVEN